MCGRVWVAGMREAELVSSVSAASSHISRATAVLRQACDTISTQSKKLATVAQLKSSMKSLEDNVAFHEASGEDLKSELVPTTTETTRLSQLFDDVRANVVHWEKD